MQEAKIVYPVGQYRGLYRGVEVSPLKQALGEKQQSDIVALDKTNQLRTMFCGVEPSLGILFILDALPFWYNHKLPSRWKIQASVPPQVFVCLLHFICGLPKKHSSWWKNFSRLTNQWVPPAWYQKQADATATSLINLAFLLNISGSSGAKRKNQKKWQHPWTHTWKYDMVRFSHCGSRLCSTDTSNV